MSKISRRTFVRNTSAATLGTIGTFFLPKFTRAAESANNKLNIGIIGVANQGKYNLDNVASENIVAICDVDEIYLAKTSERFPHAKQFTDFRKLIDHKDLDAIVVATSDHTHAVATMAALKTGRHVYCEKPLTHTVSECRAIREAAAKAGKATQMGTQIHAGDNYRRVVELIQRGAIGRVKEVHVWAASSYGGKTRPTDTPAVPETLNYDLWLGPVEPRPYHPDYLPFQWRNWWAFGGGSLADFGCHFMDLPHWALELKAPLSVETEGPELDAECPPQWLIARYVYPNPKGGDPIRLTWYHGGKHPLDSKELHDKWKSGVLFIGEKGELLSDYGRHVLRPEEDFRDFKRPEQFVAKSVGHHREWINACKNGTPTTCNFDYSGGLTEAVLLGNVAYRVGTKLEWDAKSLKAKNSSEADKFIQHQYRRGWSLA